MCKLKILIIFILPNMPKNEDLKYWKSLEYLPMRRFYKIAETENPLYLLKVSEEEVSEMKSSSTVQLSKLASAWASILEQYSELTRDKSYSVRLRKYARLGKLYSEYNCLHAAGLILTLKDDIWALEYLKLKGVKDVVKTLMQLTNKINRINSELVRLEQLNEKAEHRSVEDLVADAQLAFGYQIDAEKLTIKQWIALQKKAKELSLKKK